MPAVIDDQKHAVQSAPDHKSPARAVPQSAQQHGGHQIHIAMRAALAVAAQRDIQIVAQETRQRDVPAPPEFDDVDRLVGRVEIEWQEDAEHARQADCHIRIAGKVEIQLQRVAQRTTPRLDQG